MNLRINSCGEIFVSANPFVSRMVDEFVAKKEQWIKKAEHADAQSALIEENRIQLLGNSLRIRRICGSHPLVYYSEDTFMYSMRKRNSAKLIQVYLDQLCDDIFHDIALNVQALKGHHISMPQSAGMKSQWGNCAVGPDAEQVTIGGIHRICHPAFAHFVHRILKGIL
ncbi:MAG: YgjP-like metallopeptidase domain-containing protein [Merdibacter sp.]